MKNQYFTTITVEDFINKTNTPKIQRNHELRVSQGKVDYFNEVLVNHKVVYIAKWIGEDISLEDGTVLLKDSLLAMDGNTRKHFWKKSIAALPHKWEGFLKEELICGVMETDSINDINAWYETFDSRFQLKTAKDNTYSAANLIDIKPEYVSKLTSAISKVTAGIKKPSNMTQIDFSRKKMELFGKDYIESFFTKFEDIIPSKIRTKLSPFIVAYRGLVADHPNQVESIDKVFVEMFTGDMNNPVDSRGYQRVSFILKNLFMQDGVYSYLNPNSSGNRIEIISGVIYGYVSNSIARDNKYFGTNKAYIGNSQAGVTRAVELFNQHIKII